MYQLYGVPGTSTELGWEVGLPLLGIVLLLCLAVPVWVALGFGAIGLLVMTDVMPLTLFGEALRTEEHTSELQSLMRISYAVFCLNKKTNIPTTHIKTHTAIKMTKDKT